MNLKRLSNFFTYKKKNKKMKQTIIHELELYTLILLDKASNVLSHLTSCVAISERRNIININTRTIMAYKVVRAIKNVYLRKN